MLRVSTLQLIIIATVMLPCAVCPANDPYDDPETPDGYSNCWLAEYTLFQHPDLTYSIPGYWCETCVCNQEICGVSSVGFRREHIYWGKLVPFYTPFPIYLSRGAPTEHTTDLSVRTPGFEWKQVRSYLSGLGAATNLGCDWLSNNTCVRLYPDSADVRLVIDATATVRFTSDGLGGYACEAGSRWTLTHDDTSHQFILHEEDTGKITKFYDFDSGTNALKHGRIREITNVTLEAKSPSEEGVIFEYSDTTGLIESITPPGATGHSIVFEFDSNEHLSWIEELYGTEVVQRVDYTYMGLTHHSDVGTVGDLIQVKRAVPDSAGVPVTEYTQYRYTADRYLKGVLNDDEIREAINKNSEFTTPDDLLEEGDGTTLSSGFKVEDYASKWFTYYSSNAQNVSVDMSYWGYVDRPANLEYEFGFSSIFDETGFVKTERVGANACATCGGGESVTYRYYYLATSPSSDDNVVVQAVVEDLLQSNSGVRRTVYGLNHIGAELRSVTIDSPYDSPQFWCSSTKVATDHGGDPVKRHLKTETRPPSAHDVSTYTELRKFLQPYNGSSWANDTDTLLDSSSDPGPTYLFTYNDHGLPLTRKVKRGYDATSQYFLEARVYGERSAPDDYVTTSYEYPTKTTSQASGIATSYDYVFWDDDVTLKQRITTFPTVGGSQNGPAVSVVLTEYFDDMGLLRWKKSPDGDVTYYSYNVVNGNRAYSVTDADPTDLPGHNSDSDLYSATDHSLADNTPSRGGGLPDAVHSESKTEYDLQGRSVLTYDSAGGRHATIYEEDRTVRLPYLNASGYPQAPVLVAARNDKGLVTDEFQIRADFSSYSVDSIAWVGVTSSSYVPTGISVEPVNDDRISWTHYHYDSHGSEVAVDRYHTIPTSGFGDLSTNYDRTATIRNALGAVAATVQSISGDEEGNATVQVEFQTHDNFGRVSTAQHWTEAGFDFTVDGSSTDLGHGAVATTAGAKPLASVTYYDGADDTTPLAVGDGHITSTITYHTLSGGVEDDYTETVYYRDFRGRLRGTEKKFNGSTSVGPYQVVDLDWMDRTVASGVYSSAPTWGTATSGDGDTAYADSVATNRIGLSRTKHDDQGRVYQTEQCLITSSSGAVHGIFRTNNYYDLRGQLVATEDPYGVSTEYAYDGAGRQYQTRTVLQLKGADGGTYYSSGAFNYRAPNPTPTLGSSGGDDDVIVLAHTLYDSVGNATEQHTFESNHDDDDGLDLDGSDCVRTTTHSWYDNLSRIKAMAEYGSGNGSSGADAWDFNTAPSYGSVPTTSTSYMLVALYGYNDQTGRQEVATDPSGVATMTFYDALGRRTFVAENFTNFSPPSTGVGGGTDDEDDRVTGWEYNGLGQVTSLTAYNASSSTADQVTTYTYADPYNGSLVTQTEYPDGDDSSDNVQMAHNLDGSVASRTDQRGVVIQYTYDDARRVTLEAATTIPSGVDDTVQAIGRAYDSHGRLTSVTSYDTATSPGSGDAVNQILYEYHTYGKLQYAYLEHDGAKSGSTPYNSYGYDETRSSSVYTNGLRMNDVYPAWTGSYGNIHTDFGSSGDKDDRLSLPTLHELSGYGIRSGAPTIGVKCQYNGVGRLAKLWSEQFSSGANYLTLSYITGAGEYGGYDRFGRVKTQKWAHASVVDQVDYAYDNAGNRTQRDIPSSLYAGNDRDQLYAYDNLHRVNLSKEGTLSSGAISGTPAREQDWTLDQLGNWTTLVQKTAGSTDFTQTRAHNDANEVGTISNWADPAHDAAGNMTTIPQPKSLSSSYTATYDAWNRLVKLEDGGVVQISEYDGLHRRIQRTEASTTTSFYYNEEWQCLVESVGTGGGETAERAYLWHPTYIDAIAVRIRAAGNDEHFFTHDANFNVTAAVVNGSDAVVERYAYTPYGACNVLNGASDADGAVAEWSADANNASDIENEHLYTGRPTDPETGLQLNRHRWYHQQLGRWVSRDPIEYKSGTRNLYTYAAGNSISRLDPTGLASTATFTKSDTLQFSWTTITQVGGGPGQYQTFTDSTYHLRSFPFSYSITASLTDDCDIKIAEAQLQAWGESQGSVGAGPLLTIEHGYWNRLDAKIHSYLALSQASLAKLKETENCSDSSNFAATYFVVDIAWVETTFWGITLGLDATPTVKGIPGFDFNWSVYSWPSSSRVRGGYRMKLLATACCDCLGKERNVSVRKVDEGFYSMPGTYGPKYHVGFPRPR